MCCISIFSDEDPQSLVIIDNVTATGYTQDSLTLKSGAIYTTVVKAVNHAKLVASHETTGIRVDTTPPSVRNVPFFSHQTFCCYNCHYFHHKV